jgi:hypothetical protein
MSGACSTHGRGEKYIQRNRLEDIGLDAKILLQWILGRDLW